MNSEAVIKAIDVLKTVLGTMVLIPIMKTNPDTFTKEAVGAVQRPIVEGDNRKVVEDKMLELIKSLKTV